MSKLNNDTDKTLTPTIETPAAAVIAPENKMGLWVVLAVVLAILIGGVYYFTNKDNDVAPQDKETITVDQTNDAMVEELSALSDSTDSQTINSEIENTDLTSLDAELDNVEAELSNL